MELDNKQRTIYSNNIWRVKAAPRDEASTNHGATFPPELIERLILFYSEPNELIFDPFVGVGNTLKAVLATGRNGIGIELNPEFFESAKNICHKPIQQALGQPRVKSKRVVYNDDCRNLRTYVSDNSVRATISSPPYANMIQKSLKDRKKRKELFGNIKTDSKIRQYSEDKQDFGNLQYEDFCLEMEKLMEVIFPVTQSGGFCIWIVKDYRDTDNGIPYVSFHSDIAELGKKAGFLHQDLFIWDQSENRALHLLGSKRNPYTSQNCSFIVVLRKPEV